MKVLKKEVEEEFENDNYLTQTIKRTKKFQNEKKLMKHQNNLKNILDLIHKKIKFGNNPKKKLIHKENDEFLKEYKYFSDKFEAKTEQILKDLIINYVNRGYRIPKFSYKNNIFKVNSLIEENAEKLKIMLLENLKNKQNIIGPKTLMFLYKLNYYIKKRTIKNRGLINQYYKLLKEKEAYVKELSVEKLKEEIQNMKNLVKTIKINKIGSVKTKRNTSYTPQIMYFNTYKFSHTKNSSKAVLTHISKDNSNNNNDTILSTEENANVFIKRKHFSYSSMRLNKYSIRPQKLFDLKISNNQTISSKYTENITKTEHSNYNEEKICMKKSKPINLRMKSLNSTEKNNNIGIKIASNKVKINDFKSNTKKTTCSKIRKYIRPVETYNYYQSAKNNYFLGLKKIIDNKKGNEYSSQKKLNKYSKNFFTDIKKNYIFSEMLSENKTNISRNINISSDSINKGKIEELVKKKSKFLNKAYITLKKGKYDSIQDIMYEYLKDIKKLDNKECNDLMNHFNYKNFRNNLIELNMKVSSNKIRKKIENIYSNTYILKRISTALNTIKQEEANMDRLEKIYTNRVNKDL